VTDYKLPFFERLFFSPVISSGKYGKMKAYTDENPDYPNERAGSNDSDKDNYMDKHGWDSSMDLDFNYVLPIGAAIYYSAELRLTPKRHPLGDIP
jgi:hypothetical protein